MSMSRCSPAALQRGMSGRRKTTRRRIYLGPVCEVLDLSGFDLSRADLRGADLRGTNLSGANLSGAYLESANLFKAVLDGVDLAGAFLNGAQFLNCAQLVVTRNWQSAFRDDELSCGASIPERKAPE